MQDERGWGIGSAISCWEEVLTSEAFVDWSLEGDGKTNKLACKNTDQKGKGGDRRSLSWSRKGGDGKKEEPKYTFWGNFTKQLTLRGSSKGKMVWFNIRLIDDSKNEGGKRKGFDQNHFEPTGRSNAGRGFWKLNTNGSGYRFGNGIARHS